VAALVLSTKNNTLYVTGLEDPDNPVQIESGPNNLPAGVRLISLSAQEVEFALPHEGRYHLTIFNLHGNQYSSSGYGNAGINTVKVDGHTLPQGIYYLQLQAGDKILKGKYSLILLD
jgi:hypothetical protein